MYDKITEQEIRDGRRTYLDGFGIRTNLIITKAKGAKLWDHKGKEYIECNSQASVLNIGSCHPRIVKVVEEQIKRTCHINVPFDTIPLLLLCKKLAEIAPGNLNRVNFSLSGSTAVEGALKIALKNKPDREYFIALDDAYHGRTFAATALTWPLKENPFSFIMKNVIRVPEPYCYRCPFDLEYPSCNLKCAQFIAETIEKRVPGKVAGMILEPVMGNGGQISFPKKWHKKIREICTRHGIVLIWDEIQTGFGRTGEMFASDLYDVVPDIMTFGKAVAGGYPLSGVVISDDLKGFGMGEHLFTFSQFPISLVAALETIKIIEEENLLQRCRELGKYVTNRLVEMKKKYEIIGDVRGPGLAIGIEIVKNRKTKETAPKETSFIIKTALEKGIMFGEAGFGGRNIIKFKPPLVITDGEVEKALDVLENCIRETMDKIDI